MLPYKPIEIFVVTSLPRAIRVTEIDSNTGILGDLDMLRHLASLVILIRHALPSSQWHSVQRSARAFHGSGGGCIVHLRQNQVIAFQFDEGADSRCIALAFDQVVLPVPGEFTLFHLVRTEVNADHIRDLVAPIDLPSLRLASHFSLPQAVDQLFSKLSDGQRIDSAVDRFTADVGVSECRDIHMLELAADLLGEKSADAACAESRRTEGF